MEKNFFNLVQEKKGCTADCRVYIDVSYEHKDEAKKSKARWEPKLKQWYYLHDIENDLPTYKFQPKYIKSEYFNAEQLEPFLVKYLNQYKKELKDKHNNILPIEE